MIGDRKIIRSAPENLFLFDSKDLLRILHDSMVSWSHRARIAAELCARHYFSKDKNLYEELAKEIPQETLDGMFGCLSVCQPGETIKLPVLISESSFENATAVSAAVRTLFSRLFTADGVIPVCSESDGFALPFSLKEKTESEDFAVDCKGKTIPAWNESISRLMRDFKINFQIRVHVDSSSGIAALTGDSLQLPVLLASLVRIGMFPKYNPYKLICTGALSNGTLKEVQVWNKLTKIAGCFQGCVFFFPETTGEAIRHAYTLPVGVPFLPKVLCRIRDLAESKGVFDKITIRDIENRLPDFNDKIHNRTEPEWERLIAQIEKYLMDANDIENPELHLRLQMLKSAAYCHNGETKKAILCNQKACRFAKRKNLIPEMLRLRIEELVLFEDEERFEEIKCLSVDLEKQLDQINDPDLNMRFYGTMAQFEMFGSLAGCPKCSMDAADTNTEKAIQFARQTKNIAEITHDWNYRHLFFVLTDPGSEEEISSAEYAERSMKQIPEQELRLPNQAFLLRQKWFARYRVLLKYGKTTPPEDFPALPPSGTESWLTGLSLKYKGAILAALGDEISAKSCFQSALEKIPDYAGIFTYLRMTVFAEAFRSLGGKEFKTAALETLTPLVNHFPASSRKWMDFLKKNAPFPGLNYWY